MNNCAKCRFAVRVGKPGTEAANDGVCHRHPPKFIPPSSSSFLPINVATFWCGEFTPRRLRWWQVWRPRHG